MQITQHVFNMHIDDGATAHPGGSNNFFVGDPSDEMILIDTGDYERKWTKSIIDYYRELGSPKITAIVITHGHGDHTGGLDRVQEETGAQVRCHPKLVDRLRKTLDNDEIVVPLKSNEQLKTGGEVSLLALFTPGHEVDHVCYYLAEDSVMFTGDAVLGASSTSVRDLADYFKSLELLTEYEHDTVCPAHGPVVPPPKGGGLVQWQLDHRIGRENQVLEALRKGHNSVSDITSDMYPPDLNEKLRPSAENNVTTHLKKLIEDGVVEEISSSYSLK